MVTNVLLLCYALVKSRSRIGEITESHRISGKIVWSKIYESYNIDAKNDEEEHADVRIPSLNMGVDMGEL